jgi:hypothetical protein
MEDSALSQLNELRGELEDIRSKKHKTFNDLNGLTEKILVKFRHMFPKYSVTKKGSRMVHHPNAPGCHPICPIFTRSWR